MKIPRHLLIAATGWGSRIVGAVVQIALIRVIVRTLGADQYAAFAVLQIAGWLVALAGLYYKIPVLYRIAAPASALLVLKAAAVAGLYRFLFTRGPLWKIWNSNERGERVITAETAKSMPPAPLAPTARNHQV